MEVDVAKLRELRRRRVLTLEERGEKAGVGRSASWGREHSAMGAQPRTIRKLAKALDVDAEDLVKTEADDDSEARQRRGFDLPPQGRPLGGPVPCLRLERSEVPLH